MLCSVGLLADSGSLWTDWRDTSSVASTLVRSVGRRKQTQARLFLKPLSNGQNARTRGPAMANPQRHRFTCMYVSLFRLRRGRACKRLPC